MTPKPSEDGNNDDDAGRKKKPAPRPRKKSTTPAVTSKVTMVTKLEDNDVLMGRGALATDFEGNLRLREIVRHRQDEYVRAAKRNRKHKIAEEIIDTVKARGGRFLQGAETLQGIDPATLPRYEAAWFIVEDMHVLTSKVKQLLRDVKPRVGGPPPSISMSTSQLGQENASSVLRALTLANSSRDQQYDALLALSLASHLPMARGGAVPVPAPSAPPAPSVKPPAAAEPSRNPDLTRLLATLVEQNQRREQEHAYTNAILSRLLPQIHNEIAAAAPNPPPAPAPATDPSMAWLFDQLRTLQPPVPSVSSSASGRSEAVSAASAPRTAEAAAPAPPQPRNAPLPPGFSDLTSFLHREAAQPRRSGILETPAALRELERVLLSRDRRTPSPPRESTEDGLMRLLQSLQGRYYPPPS
eukprot:scaffold578_cov167-Amphora_coffeaeformis.AAC.7